MSIFHQKSVFCYGQAILFLLSGIAGCNNDQERLPIETSKSLDPLVVAKEAFELGNADEAAEILLPLLIQRPNDPELTLLTAQVEAARGNSDSALELANSIDVKGRLGIEASQLRYRHSILARNEWEAERALADLASLVPNDATWKHDQWHLLNLQGRRQDASELAEQLCREGLATEQELLSLIRRTDGREATSVFLTRFSPLRPEVSPLLNSLPGIDVPYVIRRQNYILRSDGARLTELLSPAAREENLAWKCFMHADSVGAKKHIENAESIESNRENTTFLRMQVLLKDGAPIAELEHLLNTLPEPSRSTALCLKALQKQDFATLKSLDYQLSKATPNLFCFSTAVQLRVQWRLQDNSLAKNEHREEAFRLLDDLLPYTKDLNTLSMRMIAAMLLNRDDDAIGTCEEIAYKFSTIATAQGTADVQIKSDELLSLVVRVRGVVDKLCQSPDNVNFRVLSLKNELESLQMRLRQQG